MDMDIQVKSSNIHKIVGIMFNTRAFVENREIFCSALGLPSGTVNNIKREYVYDNHGFLRKSLEEWICNYGVNSTFTKLLEILENEKFKSVADELTKALDSGQLDSAECAIGIGINSSKDSTGFSFEIPEKTLYFTGREQELLELHKTVMNGNGAVLAAVSGMGGIGKTTLAAQYVWKYHETNFFNVIWINSETSASLNGSFRRLARKLKLMELKNNPTAEEFKDFIAEVYEKFGQSKTLLVFDNAENYEDIKHYLPRPQLKTIPLHVLITSRNNKWNDKFSVIELGLFTLEDAMKFFEDYLELGSPEEFHAAKKLCEALGYLPIAVRQAGAYIKVEKEEAIIYTNTHQIIREYLRRFEKDCKELLDYEYWNETGEANEKTTFVTWNITIDRIQKKNEMIERILEFIAYLDPEFIRMEILERMIDGRTCLPESSTNEENSNNDGATPILKSAINLLNQYSIIKKMEDRFRIIISVHRLVQKVIRYKYREREKVLLGNAINIIAGLNNDYNTYTTLWKYALENEEVVKQFPDFGIEACDSLTIFVDDDEEAQNVMKVIKKTIEKFKIVHPHIGAYQLAVKCLEIKLLCKSSSPNVNLDRISELVLEISSNSEEFLRVENSYSRIICVTAEYIFPITVWQEHKNDFMYMAYQFYNIYFNVVKNRNETLDYRSYAAHSNYIKLMVTLNRIDDAVQLTKALVELSNTMCNNGSGRRGDHLANLEHLADNLIVNLEAGLAPHVKLIKSSMELNKELHISFSAKNDCKVKQTLLHAAFCLFLLSDAGSKAEGWKICEAIVLEDSDRNIEYLISPNNKFIPVSYALTEFGYLDLALKFIRFMKKHGIPLPSSSKLNGLCFAQLLRKLNLKIDTKEKFQEILNKIIIALERKIENTNVTWV